MNIIVCIKQVPATTEVKIDPNTNTLVRSGIKAIINPFDTYALEEGVRLREKQGGAVTVMTMASARRGRPARASSASAASAQAEPS